MKSENLIIPDIGFFLGGYFGSNVWIQSRKGTIRVAFNEMHFQSPELFKEVESPMSYSADKLIEEIKPDEEGWKTFLEVLKLTDQWKKEYWDMFVCDGTQWSLDIYWKLPEGKRKLKRHFGSNKYPEDFDVFGKALAELIHFDDLKNEEKFEFWRDEESNSFNED